MRIVGYLLLFVSALFTACPARAESPRDLVASGNELYAAGDYDKALEAYEKAAAERPDSGEILFNKGDAHFRKGQYDTARDAYQAAALNTKDLSLEAAAHYNTGNAIYAEGQNQLQTNPEKTLSLFEQSIQHYKEALRIDPHLKDAAQNIELARLAMKELADKLKESQESSKERQEQSKDKKEQQEEKTPGGNGEEPGDREQQKAASDDRHPEEQGAKKDGEKEQEDRKPAQQQSAAQEDGRSVEQEEGQKGDERKASALFSESPEDILREEKENRLQLYRAPRGGQKPVEKDW